MGEFTLNLLKLTEFPFSYSLIGLIALISGQGANIEELSLARVGPLLILVGFVATTLSICDPVGAIQRKILKGQPIVALLSAPLTEPRLVKPAGANELLKRKIFGVLFVSLFSIPYLFAMRYTPEEAKARIKIDWDSLYKDTGQLQLKGVNIEKEVEMLKILGDAAIEHLSILLNGLREQTVQTKWINGEIDRITALIYFLIIITLFIIASQIYPHFLANFGQFFNHELTGLIILIFSIVAFFAVVIMLIIRMNGLRDKAVTVFKYLASLEAVKTVQSRQMFSTTQDKVERYLDEGHWTLAKFGAIRIEEEYTEQFLQEVST